MRNNSFFKKTEILIGYVKWCLTGIFTGIILGLVAGSFHHAVDFGAEIFSKYDFMLYLMPLAGIIIAAMYKYSNMENDLGTNFAILSLLKGENIRLRTAPLIYISSVLTHITGGSSGREGAALQLGSSIGLYLGKLLKLDDKDIKIITMCGMSASFAALFGTPIAAAVFSMEIVGMGIIHYSCLVPCIISSVTGYFIAGFMGISPTFFQISAMPEVTPLNILRVIILSALTSLLSIVFCWCLHFSSHSFKKIKNIILRGFLGGVIVALITLIIGSRDYNGAGMNIIQQAISGEAKPEAFILKIILTAITLGAGFKGGEIVPSFFIGATFGCVAAPFIGLNSGFGAATGIAAIFCAVTNCPIASIFLAAEIFGGKGMIFFAIICATSYMLSGYTGLYGEQKRLYSKIKAVCLKES